jgi:prepilin-type N-terminal cleavage/methylation domain-containing protein
MKLPSLSRNKRRGLTLIEMIATLVVMVAISTIILPAANGLNSQKSFQKTKDMIEAIRLGIVGDYDPVAKRWSGGYVQDMGGLPFSNTVDDAGYMLDALLRKPQGMASHGLHALTSKYDVGIALHGGWRGPYYYGVQGAAVFPGDRILDGWGQNFIYNSNPSSLSVFITSIQSHGVPGEDTKYPTDPVVFDLSPMRTTVQGTVTYELPPNAGEYDGRIAIVRLYSINPSTGLPYAVSAPPILFNGDNASPTNEFSFSNVMVGEHYVRVLMRNLDPEQVDDEPSGIEMATAYINVPVEGYTGLDLTVVPNGQ